MLKALHLQVVCDGVYNLWKQIPKLYSPKQCQNLCLVDFGIFKLQEGKVVSMSWLVFTFHMFLARAACQKVQIKHKSFLAFLFAQMSFHFNWKLAT